MQNAKVNFSRRFILLFCFLPFAFWLSGSAQEEEPSPSSSPAPGKKTGSVKLLFLPPPMEGTLSLGIYDKAGKLVRTLHREAKNDEFSVALNGFITRWDGRDDSGAEAPAGKYSARGYCVGDEVKIKREAFSLDGSAAPKQSPQSSPPAATEPMTNNSTGTPAESATPAASPEQSSKPADTQPKTALTADTLDAVKDKLKTPDGKPFAPEEKVKLKLVANPLNQDKPGSAEVAAGFDEKGSFLKTADGLFLKRVSDTPRLKWTAIARNGAQPSALVLFQSDGTAVEEFVISKLVNMMAFDCGDFDYDPARNK